MIGRREFLSTGGMALTAALLSARPLPAASGHACHADSGLPHPKPRPGITGAKVLKSAQLADREELIPLFDGIRKIPAIADGIRCHCGCAELPGYYSLLSCYESDAMARICPICQGEGRLAVRLQKEGKSLADIRVAIDAQFG